MATAVDKVSALLPGYD